MKHRQYGAIVNISPSRSSGFWAVILSEGGDRHFALGTNFLSGKTPKVGHRCQFTPLPPSPTGRMRRATEITIVPPKRITIARSRDVTSGTKRVIGELKNGKSRD